MDYNQQGQPLLRTTGSSYDWTINISAGAVDGTSYVEKFGMNVLRNSLESFMRSV